MPEAVNLSKSEGNPKRPVHELSEKSSRLDRVYGVRNLDLARDFAELWDGKVRLKEIEAQCPRQFPPFSGDTTHAFRWTKSRGGSLVQGTLGLN